MKHLDNARELIMRMDEAASKGGAERDRFYRRYSYDVVLEIPGNEISREEIKGFVSGWRAVGNLKEMAAPLPERRKFTVRLPLATALIAFRELSEDKGMIVIPDRRRKAA